MTQTNLKADRGAGPLVRRHNRLCFVNEGLDGGGPGGGVVGKGGEARLDLLPELLQQQQPPRHRVLQEGEGEHAGARAPGVLVIHLQ